MKKLKKTILILMIVVFGIGCFFVAELFIPTAKGDEFEPSTEVLSIDKVVLPSYNFYVNQPFDVEGGKIYLRLKNGDSMTVDLKEEYVKHFDTTKAGNHTMLIEYFSSTYALNYEVEYKGIKFHENYDFDFELNEEVALENHEIDCLDFYDKAVETFTLENGKVYKLFTDTLTEEKREAYFELGNFKLSFDYSVFYFSNNSNYVGISEIQEDGFVYEINEFLPSFEGQISIVKRIAENGLIESVYNFNLKRVDSAQFSTFLSNKAVAKFSYDEHKLTVFKDAILNENEVSIFLTKGEKVVIEEPVIQSIIGTKGIKQNFYVNEQPNFQDIRIILKLSDKTNVEIEIDQSNISNVLVNEAGTFTMKINYFKFSFFLNYVVSYKSIKFYSYESSDIFSFKQGDSTSILFYELLCFDFFDNPVGFKSVGDLNVVLSNFDVSSKTENEQIRTAQIICYGSVLYFEYKVV